MTLNLTKEHYILHEQEYNTEHVYRKSLMKNAEQYGVGRTIWKYNKNRLYIYFGKTHWDGIWGPLVCQSRGPHNHSNQHTKTELNTIRDMRRNPNLGMVEL